LQDTVQQLKMAYRQAIIYAQELTGEIAEPGRRSVTPVCQPIGSAGIGFSGCKVQKVETTSNETDE
jgi:hypothetical protein